MLIIPSLLMMLLLPSIVFSADEFEDYRCKCVCPSLTVLQDPSVNETNRRVYIDVVPPDNCTCYRVVFHTLKASQNFQDRFCPRCVCNYEVRNTTTMKVVVIIIMVAISLLFIYMAFLLCLEPLVNQGAKPKTTTHRHARQTEGQAHTGDNLQNPTQECVFSEPTDNELQPNRRSSIVLHLVSHEQSKWRKQVQQQRQSVYSRHELLN
ncbi:unnamed protein product [Rotaria magnacalcarata]|uniref:Transmembrane protein 9 n=3 Tax=Rotaria magnacalcarata TaxID=392030 RepID=A0A815A9D9_9BILA|nr:unnamed protein product [Rotaria magnacalcarata]CAF2009309.1 unnamed protein product [Rotaria magnacalcarata]CAF2134629.1 unnamed protein product [Rotaria magnacalcarata]